MVAPAAIFFRRNVMNLQQLTTFCTVLSEGSMTAAADKLFLTQPAVSQQIRSLEDEMGVSLLVRGVRQVKPTVQGQLLFDYAKRILHLTQQAEVAIQTMSQEISGHLRVGTVNSIGLYLISPIIGLFLKHNSNLKIKLVYGSFETVVEGMKHGDVDFAILPDIESGLGIQMDNFEKRFLLKDEMLLVASGKDATIPPTISLADYVKKPIVLYSEMYPSFRKELNEKIHHLNLECVPAFEADNVGTLKRVIESGLGWGFMPGHSIRKQIRTGRLTHVHVDEIKHFVNVNIYSRKVDEYKQMSDVFSRAIQQQALNN